MKERLSEGETVAERFDVEEYVGHGGIAMAYRGTDRETGEDVCLKHPHFGSAHELKTVMKYFQQGIETLRELATGSDHPAVVQYIDDRTIDQLPVLVTEFVEGQGLDELLSSSAIPMAPDRAVRIAADLLDGIAYIHSRGQIYRDLKPDNVIVRPDDHPVLIDFNTAKGFDPDTDGTSAVPGESDTTIPGSFKPPEVRAPHTVDFGQGPWSDVYPVGKLIIGMLRSEGIPRGDAVDPREDTDCPDYLAEVVVTATQYDRADRYNSAQAMRSALERGGSSPPARAQLERLTGPGAVHPLEAGDTVGRAGTEEVTPNIPIEAGGQEEFVSAVQAEFDVSADGQWVLQDRSLNGTWVHKRDHRGWIRVHWADGRRRLRDGGYPAPSGEDGSVPPESIELEDGDIVALADPPRGITFRFSRSDAVTDDGTADPATTGG